MRRWECFEDGSAKFWEAAAEGASLTVRYGRVGSAGRTQVKDFDSGEAAERQLAKLVGEKERKGYREVVGQAAAVGAAAAEAVPAAASSEPAGTGGPVRPDEDTFTMPAAWRRQLHPRRGGLPRKPAAPAPDAVKVMERLLAESTGRIEQMLTAPESDAEIVAAVRAHLAGNTNPLGAAALAKLTFHYQLPPGLFTDAWVASWGLPFAARAVVELFDVEAYWKQSGTRSSEHRLIRRLASRPARGERVRYADRARALLAAADDDTYRAAVEALAPHRTGADSRIVVSYLLPSEQRWVDECCDDAAADGVDDPELRSMLLCSLGSAAQMSWLKGPARLRWTSQHVSSLATIAEGVGAACAPLVGEGIAGNYTSDLVKTAAGMLAEFPTDEAFGLLLARVDDKRVRPALLKAMQRYPVRAMRLLGGAAAGGDDAAKAAGRLLSGHVRAHRELTTAVLPELPAETAGLIAPVLDDRDRVPDAAPEALPELLVTPPWAGRRAPAAKPRVAAGPVPAPGPRVVWQADEQQAWAAATAPWYRNTSGEEDWGPTIERLRESGRLTSIRDARLLAEGPERKVRPLLSSVFDPKGLWYAEGVLKPVAARFGAEALPLLLQFCAQQPATAGRLLLPYLDVQVARLTADWLVRLKSAGGIARAWLARHGLDAVAVLVPDAVGPVGAPRRNAEQALRSLAAAHGAEEVRHAAAACGPEAAGIVGELLSADPLVAALPARMPAVGSWTDPGTLPQILLSSGGALPDTAVRHVITVLALCRPGDPYPGLDTVRRHCDAACLAAFAWELFEQWRLAGMPAKDSWALHALGLLGDDETVRRLTPVIRAWPGESAHHRAVEGLDVLAAVGTDVALMHLHGIAQRVPFSGLKFRAQEKIAEVAEELGLTSEQLADRLVPDLGLDADGSTVVDYGTRRFTVGFDEQLRPYVQGADGKRRKTLPAPGARDDAELAPAERRRFAALKKDVRTLASAQVRRLESAMVTQRSWPVAEFRELFVAHPLLWHLVRRLVWVCDADGESTPFRVAEDRTFADVEDDELTLPEKADVRLAHPLTLGAEHAAWAGLFADYEILQPFPQLGRPVHALSAEEAAGHRLTRFEGVRVPVGKVLGLIQRGWERGDPQDAGVERWISRRIDADRYLVIALDEGIAVGALDVFPEQTLETVWLDSRPTDYMPRYAHPLRLGDLPPVIASELLADLTEVTSA